MTRKTIPVAKRVKLDDSYAMINISGCSSNDSCILSQSNSQNEIDERGILHNLFISPLPNFFKKMWTQISGTDEKNGDDLVIKDDSLLRIQDACLSNEKKASAKQITSN